MTNTYETIQTLANQVYDAMEQRTRNNGEAFYCFKDGSPQWMTDMAMEAHGDMLPDDYRYEFIRESIIAITAYNNFDDAEGSIEPDIYTGQLTHWMASNFARIGYVDDAVSDYGGNNDGIVRHMQYGQGEEKREVFGLVYGFLEGFEV